ncbi:MAG: glycosyltransferase family 2 protein [Oscillospiraceae bacterium]|nr:glycosyltransferase family 2 protein [Oscillospiraceae bacterium]
MDELELTILMPCLNEAETLEDCIQKAQKFLADSGIVGEVLIADNGSTDGSQEIARRNGARVVNVEEKGYGAALIGGSNAARGKYVIMGDTDGSHDFLSLMPFVEKLREGYDLVVGNRFRGGIEKGAMSPLHRYLGNPVLSFIGRLFFPSKVKDFHCGLRGYKKESIQALNLHTTGMEYASEMIVQSTLHKLKMTEVPTFMKKDGRSRPPHLRSWHDGWRHLKFLLMHAPNWLFFYPGLVFFIIGLIGTVVLSITPVRIGGVGFGTHTLIYAAMLTIVGMQLLMFSTFVKTYAVNSRFIPPDSVNDVFSRFTMDKGVLIGVILFLLGLISTIVAVCVWAGSSFGNLDPSPVMRFTIPSIELTVIGLQLIFGGFFVGILNIPHRK